MRVIFLILLVGLINGEKWFRHYGVSKNDNLTSMIKTKDGGFIFVGSSTTLGNGRNDLWVLKTDDSLNFNWQRFYGGPFDDLGKKIFPQKDGFIIIGCLLCLTVLINFGCFFIAASNSFNGMLK